MQDRKQRQDWSARTMRIDIEPDSAIVGAGDPTRSWTVRGSDTTSVLSRESRASGRSEDFGKLLESIYDGVLIVDAKGHIIEFNSRAAEFFQYTESALLGADVIDLISGADESLLDAIQKNLRDHRYTLIEARCLRRDKTTFPSEIAVNEINLDERARLCFFVRDITVRKRAQEALEDAVARLEAHDRARSQFVSNVSHELRTPLTSMIYAVANMLRGVVGSLSDPVRRYLEMLDGDCKRLLGTVNDILDIRKLEDKGLILARRKGVFADLVRSSAESLLVQCERKSITMTLALDGGPWFVECDPVKMERVLLNVLGNAIKFTSEGGLIEVRLAPDPERERQVVLSVRDTGVGIPPEAISKVTLRYFTVGEQPSGSGLGLAISKEIVELHDGEISIMSPPPGRDRGTIVYIRLPLVTPPRVDVVDENAEDRAECVRQLKSAGLVVDSCARLASAMEYIRNDKPDAVVVALAPADKAATELILKLKSDKALMRIPLLVLTEGEVGPAKSEILGRFGIPVLGKPWAERELIERLSGVFLGTSMSRHAGMNADNMAAIRQGPLAQERMV